MNLLRAIVSEFTLLMNEAAKYRLPPINREVASKGERVSKNALREAELHAMTPWMKNMLLKHDNRSKDTGSPLRITDQVSKAETVVLDFVTSLLKKYNASGEDGIYPAGDLLSRRMYDVDCWRNKPESLRHMVPGYLDKIEERVRVFARPIKVSNVERLLNTPLFRSVVEYVASRIPEFVSNSDIKQLNAYYMSKNTNVGAPYFANDKTLDPVSKLPYKQITLNDAKAIKSWKELYPYAALFGRVTNGKPRAVLGTSRVANMYFNQVVSPFIEGSKNRSPFMLGYNPRPYLKQKFITLAEHLPAGYTINNRDYSKFDTTIPLDLKLLSMAILIVRCKDARGKRLLREGAIYFSKLYICDGITEDTFIGYARMFSGEILTNPQENIINPLVSIYEHARLDPSYLRTLMTLENSGTSGSNYMGDDNMLVESDDLPDKEYSEAIKDDFNLDVHDMEEKGEKGIFFLQNRLYKQGRVYKFSTPWPRVVRSLTLRENQVGLGPRGWCMMFYQQMDRLEDEPEIRREIIRFFDQYDQDSFGTKLSCSQFRAELAAEDNAAIAAKGISSASKLYDGDPQKMSQFKQSATGEISWDGNYIRKMHSIIRKALQGE